MVVPSQISLVASLALPAHFHACRQGITDGRFYDYFANAGELESASCEYHVYSSLIVVWRAWPFGADYHCFWKKTNISLTCCPMMFLQALYMSWKGGTGGCPIGALLGGLFSPAFFGNVIQTVA
jgi:hypothetical protein